MHKRKSIPVVKHNKMINSVSLVQSDVVQTVKVVGGESTSILLRQIAAPLRNPLIEHVFATPEQLPKLMLIRSSCKKVNSL